MSDRKKQLNIDNRILGGLPSSFVVDLRRQAEDKAEKLKKKEREASRHWRLEIKHLRRQAKKAKSSALAEIIKPGWLETKVKPDLLKARNGIIRSGSGQSERTKVKFVRSMRPIKRKSLWSVAYGGRLSAFKQAIKLDFGSHRRRLTEAEKRAQAAETKAAWYRSVLSFGLALLVIIVPIKILSGLELFNLGGWEKKIIDHSKLAVNSLMAATEAATKMDFAAAGSGFQDAGYDFLAAQSELDKINDSLLSLAALANDPKWKLAAESKKFLRVGAIASSLGNNLVQATDSLFAGNNGGSSAAKNDFPQALDNFIYYGQLAVADAKSLEEEMAKIDPDNLPDGYREKFLDIKKQAELLADNLETFVSAGVELKEALGITKDKRYLLVFQNNSELRASGGFIGSYALVDIRDGKIRNLEVPGGGSYDTEGGMKVRVAAPEPLRLVNPLWHFWDANWWPHWPTTAKNLMWFYEKSGGSSVDGVISVTPTVVERLLAVTGPIDLTEEYGLVINADNFWETVQKIAEQKNLAATNPEAVAGVPATSTPVKSDLPLKQGLDVNSDNKPKKIIGDLMAKIMETLPTKLNKDSLVGILALFEDSLAEKQILFYFDDPKLEAEVSRHNWAGEIKASDRDYLSVINTNIAGQKSDRKMSERIEHTSEISADGSIVDTVKIIRTHTGIKNEALTGVRNVDWLRVYVPQGSELLSADGFRQPEARYFDEELEGEYQESQYLQAENRALVHAPSGTKIYAEEGKTVFANWLMVDPGETVTVTIKYRLPFVLSKEEVKDDWLSRLNLFLNPEQSDLIPYSLMVQKQPGASPSAFSSRLSLPAGWKVFWRYPDDSEGAQGWEIEGMLAADKLWSIIVEKNNK